MTPKIEEFWATDSAQTHMLAKHDVQLDEATEAADSTDRHFRTYDVEPGERRYMVPGKTAEGRRLFVIYVEEGEGLGRILTAREAIGRRAIAHHKRLRGD